ncbi:signal peptidase I [bacterium]|nr:signal peptidase I [bacterium]
MQEPTGHMDITSPSDVSTAEESNVAEKPLSDNHNKTTELFQIAFVSVLIAIIVRLFFVQAFKIPTGSMEDTLLVGDLILVNKCIYGVKTPATIPLIFTDIDLAQYQFPAVREPKQGDVIVFKFPPDPTVDYIKRLVALPGQTVEIKDKIVYVDGKDFSEIIRPPGLKFEDPEIIPRNKGYESVFPRDAGSRDNYGPVIVPEDSYFVLGDNRDRSYDSRHWGFVPKDHLIGQAVMIYWSTASQDNFDIRWDRLGQMIH